MHKYTHTHTHTYIGFFLIGALRTLVNTSNIHRPPELQPQDPYPKGLGFESWGGPPPSTRC